MFHGKRQHKTFLQRYVGDKYVGEKKMKKYRELYEAEKQ